ncbi:MAG: glycosyltransferase [Opitutales bacterium]
MSRAAPRFTVVLANYNGAAYLREAVDSILAQSLDDWHLVVVDDGSTDDSCEVLQALLMPLGERAALHRHAHNLGQGPAFNTALKNIESSWTAFIDSDDRWHPDKLKAVAEALASQKAPPAILQHPLRLVDHTQPSSRIFPEYAITGDVLSWMRARRRLPKCAPTSGLVFNTEMLRQVLPVPDPFRVCADGFLTRTAACFGTVAVLDKVLADYRIHPDNHVEGNRAFEGQRFEREVMIPALNAFFATHQIDLTLDLPAVESAPRSSSRPMSWLPRGWVNRWRRGPQAHLFRAKPPK